MQRNVLEYLENSCTAFPEKVIFADDKSQITYSEFVRQAKYLGAYLLENELHGKTGVPIAVFIDRSINSLSGFFGVVYSGCFYVPIDRQMPAARIALILDTLKPEVILGEEKDKKILDSLQRPEKLLSLSKFTEETKDLEEGQEKLLSEVRTKALDTDPLYAIFTSGSTGVPKGVLVSHRSVIDLIDNFKEEFSFTDECIFGNQAPFDFDVSVKDIYSTIKNGATMYVIPKVMFSFPAKLIAFMNEKKINTIIWAVSALRIIENLNAFTKELPKYLKTAMFSGEVMHNKVLNYWRKYLPDVQYVNLYGPTEITCNCTYYKVDRPFADDEVLPIGVAFLNSGVFLLDGDRQVTEKNTAGEICIKGSSLALGYYNNAEKTAEAFCQNPLNKAYPERIYRTGDIGMFNEKGELIFLSRKDDQIKHMGHRIELGEVEAAANSLDFLDAAVCLYDKAEGKIVMFYQAAAPCDKELLKAMGKKLPKYMFPNKLCHFEKLPLNKNNKIDRTYLREHFITSVTE
ncbi:MAG: amino acid adenylation domain-containing protein [Lachnospiraceae bacterium]